MGLSRVCRILQIVQHCPEVFEILFIRNRRVFFEACAGKIFAFSAVLFPIDVYTTIIYGTTLFSRIL